MPHFFIFILEFLAKMIDFWGADVIGITFG